MISLPASLEASTRQNAEGTVKTWEDLARYRAVLADVAPTLIVEIGTFSGRSALWFAATANAEVVTVDVDPGNVAAGTAAALDAAGATRLTGRSTDPTVAAAVTERAVGHERVMVVLDGDHSAATVRAELDRYGPLVTPGSYCVVEDGIVRWMPWEQKPAGPYWGSPLDAIESFMAGSEGRRWEIDRTVEDMHPATQFPSGWLRRRR